MKFRHVVALLIALALSTQLALGAAVRHTPTTVPSNGLPDDGVSFENDVDREINALWGVAPEWLANVAGTNTITATSDTGTVSAVLAVGRPKSFWIVPANTNTSVVTLTIDGIGPYNVVDQDGNALTAGALTGGRLTLLAFDGSSFRLPFPTGATTKAPVYAVDNGRLTLSSGTCTPTSNITGATTLYWTPCGAGDQIGLYDGTEWQSVAQAQVSIKLTDASQSGTTTSGSKVITGLTDTSQLIVGAKASGTGVASGATISSIDSATQVTLSANSTASGTVTVTFKVPASTVFDVFGYLSSGALKLMIVPWTNTTTRATSLTTQDGIYVESGAATRRYLGTCETTATDGQSEFSFGSAASGGGTANLLCFNYYNRKQLRPLVIDNHVSYPDSTTALHAADATTFRINFVTGVAEDQVSAGYQNIVTPAATSAYGAEVAVGLEFHVDGVRHPRRIPGRHHHRQANFADRCALRRYPGCGRPLSPGTPGRRHRRRHL